MNDQVQQLKQKKIPAELIHSGLTHKEIDRILDNCFYGGTKLLYLSPERLFSPNAWARLIRMNINLIAVDEAHCISQWGYDFRPSYLEIARIRAWMPDTPVLALTATATPEVTKDIQEKLLFKEVNIIKSGFARNNLAYIVLKEEDKWARMASILQKMPGCGIVYVRNRKTAKLAQEYLNQNQIKATFYHAGLSQDERVERENSWKNNEVQVICATNAFGMGIDKPDVRTVIHLDTPESMEAYFQEAGRAGRDGLKAYAVLLVGPGDKKTMMDRFEANFPSLEFIKQVYRTLAVHYQMAAGSVAEESFPFDLITFCELYKFSILPAIEALKVLEHSGLIILLDGVYQPSLLQVIADKETLYRYQVKHAEEDALLKAILRSYEGVFYQPVRISEYRIAKLMEIHEDDVAALFHSLDRSGIIRYQPKSDQSRIYFKGERLIKTAIQIDQSWYSFRKNRAKLQLDKIWSYAESDQCRSLIMQEYFGDTEGEDCRICDNCLKKYKINDEQDLEYKDQIISMIKKRTKMPLQELVTSLSVLRKDKVIELLEILEGENLIHMDQEMVIYLQNP